MRRFLLGLLFLLLHVAAHAYPPKTDGIWWMIEPQLAGTAWQGDTSKDGACAKMHAHVTAVHGANNTIGPWDYLGTQSGTPSAYNASGGVRQGQWCRMNVTSKSSGSVQTINHPIWWQYSAPSCPNGGTLTNGQCVCAAGSTDTGTACTENPCTAGSTTTLNPTTGHGWITGFESGLAVVKCAPGRCAGDGNTPPASLCDGQCSVTATGSPSEFWVSKDPSGTGMHRISVIQTYTRTGSTCSTKSTDLDASLTSPCPGTMGTVGGKPVCLSTSTTETGSGGTPPLKPGTNIGNAPAAGGSGDKVGGDGQLGGGGTPPSSAGGGSTPGTAGGVVTGGGTTTRVVTRSDGTTETEEVKWGEVVEGKADGVPTIYTRKYTKSPGDYFNEKITAVSGAGGRFITAAFAPPWSDNPALCPKWSLPGASIGPWELGLGDVSVPCNVWAFCRIVIILSALFLARALVFGG